MTITKLFKKYSSRIFNYYSTRPVMTLIVLFPSFGWWLVFMSEKSPNFQSEDYINLVVPIVVVHAIAHRFIKK